MRWRTIEEVKAGKGDKICANVACGRADGLEEMEVAFGYEEEGKRKSVLVKCVRCEKCARKLRKARATDDTKKRRRSHERRHHRRDGSKEGDEKAELTKANDVERKRRRHRSREHEERPSASEKRHYDSDKHEVNRKQPNE